MARESKGNSSSRRASLSESVKESARAVTNVQNEDTSKKQNQDAIEETKTYYQTIAEEYDAGKITDESIKEACKKQNPPIDPKHILEYVHMTNLEREESPYYKSDLSQVKVEGTDYNNTLTDGQSVEVAGCTITAKTYTGEEVYGTQSVFGMEAGMAKAVRENEQNESDFERGVEWFFGGLTGGIVGDWSGSIAALTSVPKERTLYHCSSPYLGEFDYDPTMYRIGYKPIEEKDGSVSQLPVLQYIGPDLHVMTGMLDDENDVIDKKLLLNNKAQRTIAESTAANMVPKGCKVLDYTYTSGGGMGAYGHNLEFIPDIPEGVESMNCTFKGCDSIRSIPDLSDGSVRKGTLSTTCVNVLPSTLKNASSTFKGCTQLNGYFRSRDEEGNEIDQLPKGIVNTVDMFNGCEGLDKNYYDGYSDVGDVNILNPTTWGNTTWAFWDGVENMNFDKAKFGGNYTPYLSPDLMRGIYDDISDSTVMARDGDTNTGYFKDDDVFAVIRQDGSLDESFNPLGLDQDKLNQSRSAQVILAEGKVDSAHVDTSVEVVSNGMRTNNKVKQADGSYTYDATGYKKSYQDKVADTSSPWEKISMQAAVGLIAAGIGGGISNNKYVAIASGLAAGFGSSYLLPNTLYPIVSKTAEIFGSEKLQAWADKLPGAESYKKNKAIDEYNKGLAEENAKWDNNYNVGKSNFDNRISAVFGNATTQARTSMLVDKTCAESMFANGKASAQELNFAGVAMVGEKEAKCVSDTMQTAIDVATNQFNSKYGSKTTLTSADKKEMSDYYVLLMQSLESYSKGSLEGIEQYDGTVEARKNLQIDGLGMVNRAYTETAMNSLKEMNDKYHFMSDMDWAKITSLDIEGVDTANLKIYSNSYYFTNERNNAAGLTVEDIKELAKVDEKFKESMGADLKTVDERIPANYVAQRVYDKKEEQTTTQTANKDDDKKSTSTDKKANDEKTSGATSVATSTRETIDIPEETVSDDVENALG